MLAGRSAARPNRHVQGVLLFTLTAEVLAGAAVPAEAELAADATEARTPTVVQYAAASAAAATPMVTRATQVLLFACRIRFP